MLLAAVVHAAPEAAPLLPGSHVSAQKLLGLPPLAVMAIIASATFISEDLTCIGAGLLAAQGQIAPIEAVVACWAGILGGDFALYWAGRWLGEPALAKAPLRWFLSRNSVEAARRWFQRRGIIIIFATRFLPGSRAATYFTAGALRQNAIKFTVLFAMASAIWTPFLVLLTMHIGQRASRIYQHYAGWALPMLLATGLLFYVVLHIAIPASTWRGRRLLVGRWRRLTRWEFWPLWAAEGPTFFYVLYLGFLRYRRPTLFTITNPGIPPDSGFIGESKSDILRGLQGAGDALPPWTLLPADLPLGERMERLAAFMREHGLGYPIVLKPDEGQRSMGVKVVRTAGDAELYLRELPVPAIAQAYLPGIEFGVFYIRMPDEPQGKIVSITEKHLIHVTGDGKRTLEELILADDRAVCSAKTFLARFEGRICDVPAAGERVQLVETGTHARGALFLDGMRHLTPELTAAVDRISQAFDGFHFGRYDFRVPSLEDFKAGRNLRIIELNGLTGQCTHAYDPRYSARQCYAIMRWQWREAFRIGRANLAAGHRPMGKIAFLRHWKRAEHRQHEISHKVDSAEFAELQAEKVSAAREA